MTTSELKEALNQDTTLLLEVRRGNDDLLFNIEPDIIMQWCHQFENCEASNFHHVSHALSWPEECLTILLRNTKDLLAERNLTLSFRNLSQVCQEILYEKHFITARSLWSRFEVENDLVQIWKLAVLYFVEEDNAGDIFEVLYQKQPKAKNVILEYLINNINVHK